MIANEPYSKDEEREAVAKYPRVAKMLRGYRDAAGLNKTEWAERIGVARITWYKYEDGSRRPGTMETLRKLDPVLSTDKMIELLQALGILRGIPTAMVEVLRQEEMECRAMEREAAEAMDIDDYQKIASAFAGHWADGAEEYRRMEEGANEE